MEFMLWLQALLVPHYCGWLKDEIVETLLTISGDSINSTLWPLLERLNVLEE